MPSPSAKRIAFFDKTYDSFSFRLDKPRSSQIKDFFLKKISADRGIEVALASSLKLNGKTNEAVRSAIYSYHQENQLSKILGIRVIDGRRKSSIYNNISSQGSALYDPLQKILFPLPLDSHSVLIEHDFLGSVIGRIDAWLLEHWSEKKGITLFSDSLLKNDWILSMSRIFDEMGNTLNAECSTKKGTERKRHELNALVNKLISSGHITQALGAELKSSRKKLAEFIENEPLHNIMGALRLVSSAAASTLHQYRNSVGFELGALMMGEIGLLTKNEIHKAKYREIIGAYSEEIGYALDTDHSVKHVPLFYVPSCIACDEKEGVAILPSGALNGKAIEYLPCTDIQLTVECADKILASKTLQGDFVDAIADWAKKSPPAPKS